MSGWIRLLKLGGLSLAAAWIVGGGLSAFAQSGARAGRLAPRWQPMPASQALPSPEVDAAALPPWQQPPQTRQRAAVARRTMDGQQVQYEALSEDAVFAGDGESIGPGEVVHEGGPVQSQGDVYYDEGGVYEPGMHFDGDCAECGDGSCGDCEPCGVECCGPCCASDPVSSDLFPVCGPWAVFNELAVITGVHSFKGPLDRGQNGNFGFDIGVNFAGALWHDREIGYQVGGRGVFSNYSGSDTFLTSEDGRDQAFLTAGFFQRAWHGQGFQWGVVFDWYQDNYYVNNNFRQIRTEMSYLWCNGHELGFWGAFGIKNDESDENDLDEIYTVTDLYAFYWRKNLASGAQGRLWGGFTGQQDGLFGGDIRVPLSNRVDLMGNFNYLIPEQSSGSEGLGEEGWGLGANLVFYPGRSFCGVHNGLYRALLPVADNSVFMIDRAARQQ